MSPTRTKEPETKEPPVAIADDAELARLAAQVFEDDLEDPDKVQAEIDAMGPVDPTMLDPRRGLHAKIAEVILEIEYIQKTGTAPRAMGGYSFVEAGRIAAVMRRALAIRGVTMLPEHIEQVGDVLQHTTKGGGTLFIQTVKQLWRLTDSVTGETTTIESMGTGGDSGDKFSPKAQTNAMKYALQVGFLLETGDDPEKADLSDLPQGPGVTIEESKVEGVRQGGRQAKATQAQMDAIRRVAGEKELTPMALATFIGATLDGKAPEVTEEMDIGEQQRIVLEFLGDLPFDECGQVVKGLFDITS